MKKSRTPKSKFKFLQLEIKKPKEDVQFLQNEMKEKNFLTKKIRLKYAREERKVKNAKKDEATAKNTVENL